jgi:endonuclease/exonuclease/phosphatase family metal-dependent hydrolase
MIVKKKKLPFFDKLMRWVNCLFSGALLISYLAPFVNPATCWPIAFFGLAYPLLLLANVMLMVYWLFRRSIWAILPLACILIGWNVLNNNIGFRLPTTKVDVTDSNNLRVMNYNVHNFKKYGADNDISTKHEILEIVHHQQPDVIGFEEFYTRRKGKYNTLDSIKRLLKTDQVFFRQFMGNDQERLGIAMFSKYPIIDTGVIWLNEPVNLNQCIYADIQKGPRRIRVYIVHLQSIRFEPQDYEYLNDVSKEGKANMTSSRRIGSKLKTAFIKRSEQVKLVKQHMSTCPYPYIVAGDFNDTPSSFAVNQMSKGLKNAFREKGSSLGRTYNGDFPNYQIDYIMTSKQFDILTYAVIRKKLSDHYPIYSDVRLK